MPITARLNLERYKYAIKMILDLKIMIVKIQWAPKPFVSKPGEKNTQIIECRKV